jgi:hypothetical protein
MLTKLSPPSSIESQVRCAQLPALTKGAATMDKIFKKKTKSA